MSKRKSFSDKVFVSLKNKIARLDQLKVVNHLVHDTECDFTRNRKLPFSDVIMIVLFSSWLSDQRRIAGLF